jgi:hypothetical protein
VAVGLPGLNTNTPYEFESERHSFRRVGMSRERDGGGRVALHMYVLAFVLFPRNRARLHTYYVCSTYIPRDRSGDIIRLFFVLN